VVVWRGWGRWKRGIGLVQKIVYSLSFHLAEYMFSFLSPYILVFL
jgi:hypothetical protein